MKSFDLNLPIKVKSVGTYVPTEFRFSNLEILRRHPEFQGQNDVRLNIFARRILEEFGFENRSLIHFPGTPPTDSEMTSEELALKVLQQTKSNLVMADSGWNPQLLVHGTTTTSRYTGSQATSLAGEMGWHVPSYETRTGCATALGCMHLTWMMMKAGYDRAAVVTSETLSKVINPKYRDDWFGMGDGAASFFVEKAEEKNADFKVLRSVFFTKGEFAELYTTPASLPPTEEGLESGGYYLHGDPLKLREQAKIGYQEMLDLLLPRTEDRQRLRWIIPHQVNLALVKEVKKEMNLGGEVLWSADRIGNIGGSVVLYTFCENYQKDLFKSGDLILMMSVGGGLSIAGQLWEKI